MPLRDWPARSDWDDMRSRWLEEIVRTLNSGFLPKRAAVVGAGPSFDPRTIRVQRPNPKRGRRSGRIEFSGAQFVDWTEVHLPKGVIELVPESVARENVVIPLGLENDTLTLLTTDPFNLATLQTLQAILNKRIKPVFATEEQIQELINRHYGQSDTESLGSMLVEVTDTVIEFAYTPPEFVTGLIQREGRTLAAIELVSPENKELPAAQSRATTRYLTYLRHGVHLLLVDLHRRPPEFGFGQVIAAELNLPFPTPAAPEVISYRTDITAPPQSRATVASQHVLAVGERLPKVPLPIDAAEQVLVDLEATYLRAAVDTEAR
jgi:hypothetical protein